MQRPDVALVREGSMPQPRQPQGVSNRGQHAPFGKMVLDVVQNTSCAAFAKACFGRIVQVQCRQAVVIPLSSIILPVE